MMIIGLIYAWNGDEKYHETVEKGLKRSYFVTAQNCRNYRRKASSSVTINVNGKDYSVKLSSEVCSHFPVESTISVYYLKDYDEYIYKLKDYKNKFKIVFVSLLISLLPWTYFFNRYIYKKI